MENTADSQHMVACNFYHIHILRKTYYRHIIGRIRRTLNLRVVVKDNAV